MRLSLSVLLRRNPNLKRVMLAISRSLQPLFSFTNLRAWPAYGRFFADLRAYRRLGGRARLADLWPCLLDRTATSAIDPHYFYQAIWAFRHILRQSPAQHVDVGSDVRYVGILSTVVPVTFVDIRPLHLPLDNYKGVEGSVLAMPFPDRSLASISCLHVLEHIGLGRYGDPIDPHGTQKACRELTRVLAVEGKLYVSMPVGRSRVQFNGQRVSTVEEILSYFSTLELEQMSFVDRDGTFNLDATPAAPAIATVENHSSDFGLGMFVFTKKRDEQ